MLVLINALLETLWYPCLRNTTQSVWVNNAHVSAMLWLETKLVVCGGHKWWHAGQNVMFKQFGDGSCKRNRSIVSNITSLVWPTKSPYLIFTNSYNDSLHANCGSFPCVKHTLNIPLRISLSCSFTKKVQTVPCKISCAWMETAFLSSFAYQNCAVLCRSHEIQKWNLH